MANEPIESWAIVELMGHVRMAGKLSEEEHFGAKMGRLDIPDGDGLRTQFFGGASVYRVTPCTEEAARLIASQNNAAPIQPWQMPLRLPAAQPVSATDPYSHGHEGDDHEADDDDDRPF